MFMAPLVTHYNESNKMLPTICSHLFSVQFSMLFQMVCSILLPVLHFKTLLLIVGRISAANQDPANIGFEVQYIEQNQKPPKKGFKTEPQNNVQLFVAYCLTYCIVWQVVLRNGLMLQPLPKEPVNYEHPLLMWEYWRIKTFVISTPDSRKSM